MGKKTKKFDLPEEEKKEIESLPLKETISAVLVCREQIKKNIPEAKKYDSSLDRLKKEQKRINGEIKAIEDDFKERIVHAEAKMDYLHKHLKYLKENKKDLK